MGSAPRPDGDTEGDSQGPTIPVLSLWQPWAQLIVAGRKTIETRSWATKYRGPLAIHAAKTKADFTDPVYAHCLTNGLLHDDIKPLVFGAIVATATLIEVLPIVPENLCCWETCGGAHALAHPAIDGQVIWHHQGRYHTTVVVEQAYGDYTPGRFAWVLADVEPLSEPLPFRGGQALSRKVALDALV